MSDKPTKGPWRPRRLANYTDPGWVILWPDKDGAHLRRLDSKGSFIEEDAHLIAEAGTVHHETGLTPCELLEQVEQLRKVLQIAVVQNELDMLLTGDELRTARAALQATERKTT